MGKCVIGRVGVLSRRVGIIDTFVVWMAIFVSGGNSLIGLPTRESCVGVVRGLGDKGLDR